jgi:hypothetical protein
MQQFKILPNGIFTFHVPSEVMSKGLRPSSKNQRNSSLLIKSSGMVGIDGTLSVLEKMFMSDAFKDALIIKDDFPFPQLFRVDRVVVVCNRESIVEVGTGNVLTHKIDVASGGKWGISSSGRYAYLSNGVVAVVRDPYTGHYALSDDLFKTFAICNFNGQTIVGTPRV